MSVAVPARATNPRTTGRVQPRPAASASSAGAGVSSTASSTQGSSGGSFVAAALARKAAAAKAANSSSSSSNSAPSAANASATAAAGPSTSGMIPPGKDTSSSAGKIFVKPSKEWVLPERAKPGRKVSAEEPDDKRQSQNRLSQRAHRARKSDYIQTLEERLRQYEADEIHSNVRLQEVARALKADNERLKAEMAVVRDQVKDLERARERERTVTVKHEEARRHSQIAEVEEGWHRERRWMEGEIRRLQSEVAGLKVLLTQQARLGSAAYSASSSTPSMVSQSGPTGSGGHGSRKAPLACPICPDPDPDCPCQQPGGRTAAVYPDPGQVVLAQGVDSGMDSSCGLCSNADECLCRVVVEQKPDVTPSSHVSSGIIPATADSCGLCTSTDFCACRVEAPAPVSAARAPIIPDVVPTSGLETVSIAKALPLRKANGARPKANIWRIDNQVISSSSKRTDAVCTGDPSNCDACRDDRFGQEFCGHLFNDPHPAPTKPCPTCPGNCMSINSLLNKPSAPIASRDSHPAGYAEDDYLMPRVQEPLLMACCGQPQLCGHGTGCVGEVVGLGRIEEEPAEVRSSPPTMRPDQAWRELKAHPNAKFASLALLADVVARRTICSSSGGGAGGGASSRSGSPGAVPLPRDASAPTSPSTRAVNAAVHDHHHHQHGAGHDHGHGASRTTIKIDTSAVREALRILDDTEPREKRPGQGDIHSGSTKRSRKL